VLSELVTIPSETAMLNPVSALVTSEAATEIVPLVMLAD
jgi:hypothetical protein